jgi:hypothetical protein
LEQVKKNIKDFLKAQEINDIDYVEILNAVDDKLSFKSWPVDNQKLLFLKLNQPVDMRKEIFLGSLLFNSFLGQCSAFYLKEEFRENFCPIASDIHSHYFLITTEKPLRYIKEIIWNGLSETLPELYFNEDPNLEKGIFGGQQKRLSEYHNSNIQPFPVMVVPKEWAKNLELSVRSYLLKILENEGWFEEKLQNILANIAFFYGTVGNELQSPAEFLRRLVTDYELIDSRELALALNFEENYDFNDSDAKKKIHKRLNEKELIYKDKLQELFINLLQNFKKEIEENGKWLTPYHHKKDNYLDYSAIKLLNELTRETTLAGEALSGEFALVGDRTICRICGTRPAILEGATIIANDSFTKFHNHSIYKAKERICVNCAFYAYLHLGFAGTGNPVKGWIPKQENLLFFYNSMADEKLKELHENIEKEIKNWQKDQEQVQRENSFENFLLNEYSDEVKNFIKVRKVSDIHIFKVGIGETPLCVVTLPNPINIEQKRFQSHFYILLHLILWIRKLNNNQGTFFFNTLPELKEDFSEKIFIDNRAINIEKAEKQLKYLKRVVNKFSSLRKKDKLKYRLHLAEVLTEKPLEVFSHILREKFQSFSLKEKTELTNLIFMLEEGKDEFQESSI